MQAQLLVGPITPINCSGSFSSTNLFKTGSLISSPCSGDRSTSRRPHHRLVVASSSSSSSAALNGGRDHYSVLGISRSATSAEIKRAYRLLARKYHPDVSKDSRAPELFKNIHCAYEVLSNEVTRTKYDQSLKFQKETIGSYRGTWSYNPDSEDSIRVYKWAELRRKMQYEKYWKRYKSREEDFSFYGESSDEEVEENNLFQGRGSFSEVLRSAIISLFLLKILGSQISLTFSSLTALLDKKLDAGYKIGYLIAWIMGGVGGIFLTLFLSFASWVCGKTSSSVVVLVVVATWFSSNLARHAPLPQGALLVLMYMSLKLQADSS